jgi:hypothetical protein
MNSGEYFDEYYEKVLKIINKNCLNNFLAKIRRILGDFWVFFRCFLGEKLRRKIKNIAKSSVKSLIKALKL